MVNSLSLGDVLLNALLSTIEADLSSTCTHIAIVGIGHLTGSVDDTSHDTNLQTYQMTGSSLNLGNSLLKVVECTSAARTRDILSLGEFYTRSLQNAVSKVLKLFSFLFPLSTKMKASTD